MTRTFGRSTWDRVPKPVYKYGPRTEDPRDDRKYKGKHRFNPTERSRPRASFTVFQTGENTDMIKTDRLRERHRVTQRNTSHYSHTQTFLYFIHFVCHRLLDYIRRFFSCKDNGTISVSYKHGMIRNARP